MRPDAPTKAQDEAEALKALRTWFAARGAVGAAVALSGGADSALVLDLAVEALGPERVLAVTSRSESLPHGELDVARALAERAGVEHVTLAGSEVDLAGFRQNGPDRCYHCKDSLYGELARVAEARGLALLLDGTNADDLAGHRPGHAAALRHGVRAPLLECGVGKALVRALSRARHLPTWDKPQEACLSSRFPHGTEVTREGLARVDACERALKALGFPSVRVRVHDRVARIEVPPEDLPRLLEPGVRAAAVVALKHAGFTWVALDLEGYRPGSLEESLRPAAPARASFVDLAPLSDAMRPDATIP